MRGAMAIVAVLIVAMTLSHAHEGKQKKETKKEVKKSGGMLSFKENVFPIIERACLPCHAEENFNPSELSLDSYELLKMGGKHGEPFVAGKSKESIIVKKLGEEPPFGEKMPLNSKKKIREGKAKWLTEEEIKTIATWVDQGAKDN